MVDFQSRDTSRGYGDDEDEEADAEGDAAAAAEGEQTDEPTEGEPTAPEAADEHAPETEGADAVESDRVASDGERDADASTAPVDDDAAEPGGDPLAGSSGGASGDPLAPDTGDTGATASDGDTVADSPVDDAGGPTVDDGEHETTDGAQPEAVDDGRGAGSAADDPLSPSGGSERAAEPVDGPDDHPFADDAAGAETAIETDTGGATEPNSAESDGHHGANGHPDGSGGHSHGADDHAHESGGHSHGADDRAHESGGHSHGHAHGAEVGLLGVAVVTVSSTRTRENDPSGDVIEALVEAADHEVVTREILRDDLDGVQTALLNLTGRDDVDVVVTTGGTGVTPDDVTVEGARPLFDRELPGFGELFRILSYEEIGTRAMVSRATAGMVDGVPVFCLPGSEAAARLGTEELVVEEMAHLVSLARRDD